MYEKGEAEFGVLYMDNMYSLLFCSQYGKLCTGSKPFIFISDSGDGRSEMQTKLKFIEKGRPAGLYDPKLLFMAQECA